MLVNRDAAYTLAGAADKPAGRHFRLGLAVKLALAFIGLVSVVFVVSGALNMWLGYREAEHQAVQIQQEKARDAASRIEEFVSGIQLQIGWTTPPQWNALPLEQRRYDFIRLLREVPAISEIAEIDGAGKQQLMLSRTAPDSVGSGTDFATDPRFVEAEAKGVWFSPVLVPQSVGTLYDDRGRACRASRRRHRCRGQSEVYLGPDQRNAGRA